MKERGKLMKAVIDRFEKSYAVILVGDNKVKIDLPITLLPKGATEGSLLKLNIELDQIATAKQKEKIEDKLNKLKNKQR